MTHDPHTQHASDVRLGATRTLNTTSTGRLARLGDVTDVRIADGEPDVRGWTVKGPAGNRVGKVGDLILDTGAMKVRYLEVQLDKDVAEAVARSGGETDPRIAPSRYALVPIGIARLDRAHARVYLSAGAVDLIGLPEPERRVPSREHEQAVVRGYGLGTREGGRMPESPDAAAHGDDPSDRFYDEAHFDENAFFGPRRRAGESSAYIIPATAREIDSR